MDFSLGLSPSPKLKTATTPPLALEQKPAPSGADVFGGIQSREMRRVQGSMPAACRGSMSWVVMRRTAFQKAVALSPTHTQDGRTSGLGEM
jgi:hypothetical protein